MKKKYEKDVSDIMEKINYLEKQNEKLKNELKTEKYPKGALVYIMDYTDEEDDTYRLGKSDDINNRKKIYDTHTIYKKKVVLMKEVFCPLQFETCLKSLLYNYRIKNRKDFYKCDIRKIEKAFKNCEDSIQCMNQDGGDLKIINSNVHDIIQFKINILYDKQIMKQNMIHTYDNLLNNDNVITL